MFEKDIERDTALNFTKEAEFTKFTEELNAQSSWFTGYRASELEVVPVKSGSAALPKSEFVYSSAETVNEMADKGGLYLKIGGGIKIPINLSTAPFTMDDRAGARCKLVSDLFNMQSYEKYAEILNEGFTTYGSMAVKMLMRGGRIHAIHTNKYVDLSQNEFRRIVQTYMNTNFPTSSFISAGYTAERTYFDYAVCQSRDSFFSAYAEAWIKAGLPEPMLKKSYPILSFSTGDTGKQAICITPKLRIGNGNFPLGTELSIKHASSAREDIIVQKCTQVFSEMQEGLNTIEDMLKIELVHPYAVFVRAAMETGIVGKAKAAISAVLDNFKDFYIQGTDTVTAFNVYYEMCQIENYGEFEQLSAATKLQVLEALNRLIKLNWRKLDVSGREEF